MRHTQNHPGFQLSNKLSFKEHTNKKVSRATNDMGILIKIVTYSTMLELINYS